MRGARCGVGGWGAGSSAWDKNTLPSVTKAAHEINGRPLLPRKTPPPPPVTGAEHKLVPGITRGTGSQQEEIKHLRNFQNKFSCIYSHQFQRALGLVGVIHDYFRQERLVINVGSQEAIIEMSHIL